MKKMFLKNENHGKKKGATAIEAVVGLLALVMIMAFFVDMLTIVQQRYTVSQTANTLVRTIATQGGIQSQTPNNYPNGDANYVTSMELYRTLSERMLGLDVDEWSLTVTDDKGVTTNVGVGTKVKFDYRESFTIAFRYDSKWHITNQIIPGMSDSFTITQKRTAISEYEDNYNEDWSE